MLSWHDDRYGNTLREEGTVHKFAKCLLGLALVVPGFANATLGHSVFSFTDHFAGGPSSSVTTPWVTASFADLATDTVRLTISGSGLEPGQRLSSLSFNLTTYTPLTFTYVSGPAAVSTVSSSNSLTAGGSGYYDVQVTYDTRTTVAGNPNPAVFTSGASSTYVITGAGLTSASFSALSSATNSNGAGGSGQGPFYGAGKIVFSGSGGSSWVSAGAPVTAAPEPGVYAMMLVGLALVAGSMYRRRSARRDAG
jgi:hypothetical protein